jgi:hypothetical protein
MIFTIKARATNQVRKVNAHGGMWSWTRWMALCEQPVRQRRLHATESHRKWVQFNEEKGGNMPIYFGVIQ